MFCLIADARELIRGCKRGELNDASSTANLTAKLFIRLCLVEMCPKMAKMAIFELRGGLFYTNCPLFTIGHSYIHHTQSLWEASIASIHAMSQTPYA